MIVQKDVESLKKVVLVPRTLIHLTTAISRKQVLIKCTPVAT